MKAVVDLFSTDYGLFSISGIVFMIGMAIWFYRFFFLLMELFMLKNNGSFGHNLHA